MEAEQVKFKVKSILEPLGFECYPFQVGWYNELVQPEFRLNYSSETLAIVNVSTPSMFEKAFKPFVMRNLCTGIKDPIDECVSENLLRVQHSLGQVETDILMDYELDHNRRPRILIQTAGHVAGAARYYQRKDLTNDPWPQNKKIFGVSFHPKYGGWFAFRGVIIFKNILAPNLTRTDPPDPLPENEERVELLKRLNECWQDWTFRDIIPVNEKYSEEQKLYFGTMPKDRKNLVEKMKASGCIKT